MVVEARSEPVSRIGESLSPAAMPILRDLGLLADVLAGGHAPWYANRAVWGEPNPTETDFLRDPNGHGLHLDRPRFDALLARAARDRGAEWIAPARISSIERGSPFRVVIDGD